MKPVRTLPAAYHQSGAIDVKKNQSLLLALNLVGLVLMAAFGWLFFRAVIAIRPQDLAGAFRLTFQKPLELFGWIAAVLALTALAVVLHEAIHGLFFWAFTRSRPRFGVGITYAYAGAPDWYLPRGQFLATTLAPLVIMSLLGLAFLPVVPSGWVLPLWYILTFNAGGAVGDLLVAGWLLVQPRRAFVQDTGEVVTLYLEER